WRTKMGASKIINSIFIPRQNSNAGLHNWMEEKKTGRAKETAWWQEMRVDFIGASPALRMEVETSAKVEIERSPLFTNIGTEKEQSDWSVKFRFDTPPSTCDG
ncbi:hypothetical protein Ahia01_000382300, partial [Argonauta hians]